MKITKQELQKSICIGIQARDVYNRQISEQMSCVDRVRADKDIIRLINILESLSRGEAVEIV